MRVFSMTEGGLSDILEGWKWDENQDQDSFSMSSFLFFSLLGREGIGRYDETHTYPHHQETPTQPRVIAFSETSSIFLYTRVVATRLELRTRMIPLFFSKFVWYIILLLGDLFELMWERVVGVSTFISEDFIAVVGSYFLCRI